MVDKRRLRDFVVSALLLLTGLAALVVVATAWGLSLRASVLLALGLLVPGLLWLALHPCESAPDRCPASRLYDLLRGTSRTAPP